MPAASSAAAARGRRPPFAHTVPFVGTAGLLFALEPLSFPVDFALLAHAWAIPELYARRGANVVRPKPQGDDALRAGGARPARRPRRP